MAIASYSDLASQIANWLHRGDAAARAGELISLGEARVNRELWVPEREASLSITTAAATVPADFQRLKWAYIDESPQPLTWAAPHALYAEYPYSSYTGRPKRISRVGTAASFIFGPTADDTYTVTGIYYKELPAISSEAHDTFLAYPDLYFLASMAYSGALLKQDARVAMWNAAYEGLRDQANSAARAQEQQGPHQRSGTPDLP